MLIHVIRHLLIATALIVSSTISSFAAPFAFVPQETANTVSVIDLASGLITRVIPVSNSPSEVAVSPDGRKVYVGGTGSGLGVIDTSNNTYTTLAGSTAYGGIHGLALSADGRTLYAVQTSGTMLVINTTTGSYTSIAGVNVLTDIALSPDGSKLYVTNYYLSTVSVVATADNSVTTVSDTGSTIALPYGVAFVPGTAKAYVANSANNTVSIIDTATNTVTGSISGMSTPLAVAVSTDGTRAYVSNHGSSSVAVIDTATDTVLTSIPVGGHPRGISVTPDGSRVIANSDSSNATFIIDTGTNTLSATVATGSSFGYGNSTPATTPVTNGLVSLWRGEGNAFDALGSNNGSWVGTPTYAAGRSGQAFSLNGTDQAVTIPDNSSLDVTNSFTLSAWVKPATIPAYPNGSLVLSKIGPVGNLNGYQMAITNNGSGNVIWCGFNEGGNNWPQHSVTGGDVPVGGWSHIACSYDNNTLAVHLDGVPVGSTVIGPRTVANSSSSVKIGSDDVAGQFFNGLIDDAAIYNRALGSGEMLSLARNAPVVTPPYRDELNGGMRPEWRITNPNLTTVATHPSALRLTTTATDLAGTTDNLQNLLTLPLPNDADNITVTAKLSFPVTPSANRQQVGVVLLAQDPNNPDLPSMENYFRAMYGYNDGLAYGYARDINNTPSTIHNNMFGLNIPAGVPFWIRVTKKWKEAQQYVYTAAYSNEGNYFHEYLSGEQPFPFTHVGVFALQGVGNATPLAFDVDYVEVAPLAQPGTMPSGLVSWWAADNNPNDALGLNHATLVGSPSYATGIVNQAFSFNGTSQYAQVATPLNLPVGGASRTVSLWFKTPQDLSSSTESALIQYGTASAGNMFGLITSGNAPGKLYFYGHSADVSGLTTLQPDTWYHAAAVYDGTTVRLYLNGTPDGEATLALNTVLDASGLTIGYRVGGAKWQGLIEDVAIFDRALNPTEIQFIMNATRDITPDNLNFTAVTNATLSTSYESNTVTISGINMPADISIINGEYTVSTDNGANWSAWTTTARTVSNGTQVKVRHTSSSTGGTATSAELFIGTISGQFQVTTQAVADTTPNAFSFTSLTGVQLGTVIESNAITVAGINAAASISIADGEYAISTDNGSTWGIWTSADGTVSLNNQVKVRQTSSANPSFTTSATLTIGGVNGSFDVTTHETPLVVTGLVSWWKAENNPLDAIGGNHGTWTSGTPAYAAGRYGQAFNFDGVSGAVGVGMLGTTAQQENLAFSISGWIKVTDINTYQVIAGNYMGERNGIDNYYTYMIVNTGNLVFGIGKRQLAGIDVSAPIATGWHQVTATYDGSVLNLYLDGHLKGTATRNFSGSTDNTRGWYIGNFSPETNSSHCQTGSGPCSATFNGLIDELAIYNRAITATEAVTLFNQNLDFEIDPVNTAGPAISDWTYEFFTQNDSGTRGANPTADHELKTTNARSFSGSKSVFSRIRSFGGSSNFDPDFHYPTHLLTSNYLPQPGKTLTAVDLWRSDISYTTSSRWFYWFALEMTDGTNTHSVMLACRDWGLQEGCTNDFQDTSDQTASGSDGQLWYRHRVLVPQTLDQSKLKITVRHTERSWDGTSTESSLYYDLLTEETAVTDQTPDTFSFSAQTGVALSSLTTSDAVTVSGINAQTPISITGGEFKINSGSWTSAESTVVSGDTVTVRQTSSNAYSTTTDTVLNIGGVSDTFSVTTLTPPPINGTCDNTSTQTPLTATPTSLCTAGTPSTVTGTGPWNWTCAGQYGGTTDNCSASIQTYTVTFQSGANGSITGTASQTVNHGASTSQVTAVADTNYHFVNWTSTGGFTTSISNPLTVSTVTAAMTITANFAHDPVNGACGSSNSQTLTATPASNLCSAGSASAVSGSGPWSWTCDGQYDGTTASCSASIQTYTVTFQGGGNGSITGTASQTVNHGASASQVTAVPATGYSFINWTGTGGFSTSIGNPLTVGNVTSMMTITANFADITAPVISAFTLPATTSILTIPILPLTATDGAGITGWCITETSSSSGCSWSSTKPTTVTASSDGAFTFYVWARDAAGNISPSAQASTTITLTKGDLNGDGTISIAEVLQLYLYVAGPGTLTAIEQQRADVAPVGPPAGDGKLDINDVIIMLRRSVYGL